MKCPNCNKEMEDRDVCLNCKYEVKESKSNIEGSLIEKFNTLSNVIMTIGILLGIVLGIATFLSTNDIFKPFISILLSIIMSGSIIISAWFKALILNGEAEKIRLLEEIKNK